jgi:hypothetical protein
MSQRDKLLEKIRNNPRQVRFEDLDLLLKQYGFVCRQPRGGSSHYVYSCGPVVITIARHKPHVHSKAVRQVLEFVDQLLNERE